MSHFPLLASYGETSFVVDGADFDGTNDFMARGAGLTGAADSKSGILSLWIRIDSGNGLLRAIFNLVTTLGGNTARWTIFQLNTNAFRIIGVTSAGSTILTITTSTTYTASATWLHLLASWDLAASAAHWYVNDTDDLTTNILTNATIDYTVADSGFGADPDGGAKYSGCFAELYFAPGQYLDFSVEANRRKFISSAGKPVDLGTDGSRPTGTAPLVYQHLDNAEAVANFAVNAGTGGNFSITGTLATASTSPSD